MTEAYQKIRLAGALILDPVANPTPAVEKTACPSPTGLGRGEGGRRYRARFVRAGRVQTGAGGEGDILVLPAALSQAVQDGHFDHKAVFIDHAGWSGAGASGPSLERLVGVTRAAAFVADSVEGELELYDTPLAQVAASLLDDLLRQGEAAPDVGLSIVFYPLWKLENETRQVIAIQAVESIDLVFQPAADGRVLAALSAHAAAQPNQPGVSAATQIEPLTGGQSMSEVNPTILPSEAGQPAASGTPPVRSSSLPAPQSPAPQSPAPATPAPHAHQPWEFASLPALPQSLVDDILARADLPPAARARLGGGYYPASGDLEGAINAERAYLAELSADQVVQLPGAAPRSPRLSGMHDSLDRLALAIDSLIAGVRPPGGIQPLTGIREAYHLLSGDYEMSGLFQPERVAFANVNSSTMAALVANAMNKRLVNEFQGYPQWWAPFVSVEDFTTLQDVRWITLGGVGELPTVAEGAAYTELSWDDKTETAAFVKKGGYLGITLEAIDKDDVGRLRAAPRALAQAAWLTLSKAISNIFTANSGTGPTVSDSTALFTTGHGNLGTAALSVANFAAARLAMRKQTELNSGERLGALTAPKYLLVPPDLEITALQVLASENDYTYALSNAPAAPANVFAEGDGFNARMQAARARVIVVDLWTDTNDWAAVADPRMYPTIGLGFRYGRTPEIFSVASPTAGLMFSNDTMPIKARFFFAVGPVDWKGLYKANVA